MGMRYVEAPEDYVPSEGDGPSIFLAGGITGCEDWQTTARGLLFRQDVVLFNPRRADFDVTRGDSAQQQIDWEFRHLHRADLTMFWFPACDPKVTVQPIAMYELGAALGERRRIVVGADAQYPRRLDVVLQLRHVRPELVVGYSLEETLAAALAYSR